MHIYGNCKSTKKNKCPSESKNWEVEEKSPENVMNKSFSWKEGINESAYEKDNHISLWPQNDGHQHKQFKLISWLEERILKELWQELGTRCVHCPWAVTSFRLFGEQRKLLCIFKEGKDTVFT